jgi:large subunit ribosomal protein L15
MPLQRRLPKRGFISLTSKGGAEVRLAALSRVSEEIIDMLILKQAGIIPNSAATVKVILSGTIERAVRLRGVAVSKGARAAIEAVGGSVE